MTNRVSWKAWLGLALSAIWLGVVAVRTQESAKVEVQILVFGLLPLIVLWGAVWGIARLMREASEDARAKPVIDKATLTRLRIRTAIIMAAIVVVGLGAASALMRDVPVRGDASVAYWAGGCLVWALLAYGVVRLIHRWPYGFAAIAASVFFVCGVNFQAYRAEQNYQVEASIKKSAPLLTALLSGVPLTDEQIKAAQVGMMEPMLLSQALQLREMTDAMQTYQAEITTINIEAAMGAESLGTDAGRRTLRGKVRNTTEATKAYVVAARAALSRGRERMHAVVRKSRMNAAAYIKAYDEGAQTFDTYLTDLEDLQSRMSVEILGLATLLDEHSRHFALRQGDEPQLVFDDDDSLAAFKAQARKVAAFGPEAEQLDQRMADDRSKRQGRLDNYMKKAP